MDVRREGGIERHMDTMVTHKVPAIKGAKPNCPSSGFHDVENSVFVIG